MNLEFEKSLLDKKRTMSRFHAQELLLHYAENELDSERRESLERYLENCKDTQAELEAINAGLELTRHLRDIELNAQEISKIVSAKIGWRRVVDHLSWARWPELARWSVEAVIVGVVIAAFASILPMKKIVRWLPGPAQQIILAETKSDYKPEVLPVDVPVKMPDAPPESSPSKANLTTGTPAAKVAPEAEVAKPKPIEKSPAPKPTMVVAEPPKKEIPAPENQEAKANPIVAPATINSPTSDSESEAQTDAREESLSQFGNKGPNEKGPKGFVYRAFLSASQIESMTEEVRQLVLSLGGEKAGSVDLGWRKARGTYFHFSLPESNYEQLMTGLKAIGPVRIYKDAHWRVMPEGQIRLILFVEDLSLKK